MNAQWKKFDGSEEQISEILNAMDGWKYLDQEGHESYIMERDVLNDSDDEAIRYIKWLNITEYMLCVPHPHADMIIEWARTGREVYGYLGIQDKWLLIKEPTWNPSCKYSFNPDGDGNAK